jgi:hypothetical protein
VGRSNGHTWKPTTGIEMITITVTVTVTVTAATLRYDLTIILQRNTAVCTPPFEQKQVKPILWISSQEGTEKTTMLGAFRP